MSNQKETLANLMSQFLSKLNLNLDNPSLKDTPKRVAKMYCDELFSSLQNPAPDITVFPNEGYNEIILLDNIPFVSNCEHHLVFFTGRAWFAYIPDKWLVGASKIARLIDYHSKKPQLQERLTRDVLDDFCCQVLPLGAMIVMRGTHGCMAYRGVKTGEDAGMMTSAVYGVFATDPSTKAEGLNLIQMSMTARR